MEVKYVKVVVNNEEVEGVVFIDGTKYLLKVPDCDHTIEVSPKDYNEYTGYDDSFDQPIFNNDIIEFQDGDHTNNGQVFALGYEWFVKFDEEREISLDGLVDAFVGQPNSSMMVLPKNN